MFCNKCGASLRDGAKFCNVCGEMTKYGKGLAAERATQIKEPEPEPEPEPEKILFPNPIPLRKPKKYKFQIFADYWNCEFCGNWNGLDNDTCEACGEKRSGDVSFSSRRQAVNSENKNNDGWICPKCGKVNSKMTDSCSSCGHYK